MDDSIIYIRAPFSLDRDLASALNSSRTPGLSFRSGRPKYGRSPRRLEEYTGFLDSDSIESLLAAEIEDEKLKKQLSRFISFLDKMLAQSRKSPQGVHRLRPEAVR